MIEEEIEWQNGRKWTNTISRSSNEQSQPTSSTLNYRNSQNSRMANHPFSSSSNTSTITADVLIRRRTRRKTAALTGGGDGSEDDVAADSQLRSKNLANYSVKYGKKSILVIFVIILVNLVCYANCSGIDSSSDYNSNNRINTNSYTENYNYSASAPRTAHIYSNHFAVHVPAGEQRANEVASKHGFINTGQVRKTLPRIRQKTTIKLSSHHLCIMLFEIHQNKLKHVL